MSGVWILGSGNSPLGVASAAALATQCSVLWLAPEAPISAAKGDWEVHLADPGTVVGQGFLGDLLRQRDCAELIVYCLPTRNDPFPKGGQDDDQQLLAALATLVAVGRGVVGLSENPGTQLLVVSQAAAECTLNSAAMAFVERFAKSVSRQGMCIETLVLPSDTDAAQAALQSRMSALLGL